MVCSYKLKFKVEYDPIKDGWDFLLLLFWGRLPLEVVFILKICKIWFGHLSWVELSTQQWAGELSWKNYAEIVIASLNFFAIPK